MIDIFDQLAALEMTFGFYRSSADAEDSNEINTIPQKIQGVDDRTWQELTTYYQLLYLRTAKDNLRTIKKCAVFFVVLAIICISISIISIVLGGVLLSAFLDNISSFFNETIHSTSSYSYYY